MGFTTGFLGGLTLTYSILYLSVYVHRQNRAYQSLLLQQQTKLLRSKTEPPEPEYEPPAYRLEQAGVEEQFKDRWNRLIETGVRTAQTTDWERLRLTAEDRIRNAFNNVRATESGKQVEQAIQTGIQETGKVVERAQDATKDAAEQAKQRLQEAQAEAVKSLQSADKKIRESAVVAGKQLEKAPAQAGKVLDQAAEATRQGATGAAQKLKETMSSIGSAADETRGAVKETVRAKRLLEL